MHDHSRVAVALAPAPKGLQVRGIRARIGLKELDKLYRREFVALEPAEDIVDSRGKEGNDGVDSVRSIERWFPRHIPGAHKIAGVRVVTIATAKHSVGAGVKSPVTIDLEQRDAMCERTLLETIEETTPWLSIPHYSFVASRSAGASP